MLAIQEMQYQVNDSLKDKLAFLRVGFLFLIAIFFVVGLRHIYFAPDKFDLKPEMSRTMEKQVVTEAQTAILPTPTASEIVYKIKVINSTGVSGLALKTAQAIKDKGVKMEEILANGGSKTGIEIIFSDTLKDESFVRSILVDLFPNAKVSEAKQAFDVVIDIGK